MKVLGVGFSHRKGGNSEILLNEALKGAKECGAQVEFLGLRNQNIGPCIGCQTCRESGVCALNDGMQAVYTKLEQSDGLILASPVYNFSVSGLGKAFMDRIYALKTPYLRLMNKVGGAITVASSSGNISAHHTFNMFFLTNRMFPTDYVAGYAAIKGHITRHRHAMLGAYELGRMVAKTIELKPEYPEEFKDSLYLLVKKKYGVHMSPFEDQEPPAQPDKG
jgi:multimeric flavodoxin WrbA